MAKVIDIFTKRSELEIVKAIYEPVTETAKKVRKVLKTEFPNVKFAVRSNTYALGSSIDVYWVDGPFYEQVIQITAPFQPGYLDGRQNYNVNTGYLYEDKWYNGADCIFANRKLSSKYRTKLEKTARQMFVEFDKNSYQYNRWLNYAELELRKDELRIKQKDCDFSEANVEND